MQIHIKNLSGSQTSLEVDSSHSIQSLKEQISTQQNIQVSNLKLLYKGRILEDSKLLSDYQITSGGIIVMMISKSKPAPVDELPEQQVQASSTTISPQESEESIERLIAMNFSRENSIKALQAANQDLNLAIEYLLSGNVPEVQKTGTFDFLMQSQEFLRILDIIRANPRELEPFLNQLETTNTELFTLITANQREFLDLITNGHNENQIQLAKHEEDEIRELMELGFSAQDAVEAYLSCNKNKAVAANFLLQNLGR